MNTMTINQFINANNLKPADALEMACPTVGYPKHYAIYAGIENGCHKFIANIKDGVQLLSNEQLQGFVQKYEVTDIERFNGSLAERKNAMKRAIKRIGEKAYSIIFNNCEHFKNWVLYGEDKSKQVASLSAIAGAMGGGLLLAGLVNDNKRLQKAGAIILGIMLLIFIVTLYLWQSGAHKRSPDIRDK